jgi:hypothetical protein
MQGFIEPPGHLHYYARYLPMCGMAVDTGWAVRIR